MFVPNGNGFWKKKYVTYRRFWLDFMLSSFSFDMRGIVLDLGGKRENKRGSFVPPEDQASVWWYVNLDISTTPNVYADVTRVPIQSQKTDCIICTEVLEHLPTPQACVDEIHRLLRHDGVAFVSVPFFYPVHADPYDFQRFTEDGLKYLFRNFSSVEVMRMGGYAGVLGLLLEIGITGVEGNSFFQKIMRWVMKWISRGLCRYDLGTFGNETELWKKFTTGYFVRAVR